MRKKLYNMCKNFPDAFSLAEVLAALVIASMILIAVLGVYSRVESSSNAIISKLESSRTPREILQLIAEDLDRIITDSDDTTVTFQNKSQPYGFNSAILEINRTYHDKNNNIQTFEKIIWQTAFDFESGQEDLVLYRSHSGLNMEDKLLDETRELWQRDLFVPVCSGLTFFQIRIKVGTRFLDRWTTTTLPRNIVVTISFEQPVETIQGNWEIPEQEKITRTIALDRTRKIAFKIVKKEYDIDVNIVDVNELGGPENISELIKRDEVINTDEVNNNVTEND